MILVANKVDLVHLRKVTEEQGRELAAQLKVCVHLCRCQVINVICVSKFDLRMTFQENVGFNIFRLSS